MSAGSSNGGRLFTDGGLRSPDACLLGPSVGCAWTSALLMSGWTESGSIFVVVRTAPS